ncbi:MAG: NAD-dependent epimerase/dehydratase family protein [Pseudomonadales bacterium]
MFEPVNLNGKKILITGPSGQVALPVVEQLAQHNDVYAIARFSNPDDQQRIGALGATTQQIDLASDSLADLPNDFDYVLNFAIVKSGDFTYDLQANAEGVGRLMLHCQSVKAFLHFSSTAVYQYAGHEPLAEDAALGDNHRSMFPTYSICKIAAESVVRFVARQFDIPTTIARLSVPYGDNGGWPYYHMLMMQNGVPIDIHPERPNVYNLLHSSDYLEKIPRLLAAATSDVTTLNFGGSQAVSVEEWCDYIAELTGFTPQYREDPKAFGSLQLDTAAMHAAVGETSMDWRVGIRAMLENLAPEVLKAN